MIINPDMLPKVRSRELMASFDGMPCALRLGLFAGIPCAPIDTVVGCHLPTIGKGTSTKVSDLYAAAGCMVCHDLLDGRDPRGAIIEQQYPAAWAERLLRGHHETLARWVAMGLITGPDWRIV